MTGAKLTCPTCQYTVDFEVLRSAAGWYVGTQCECGPYSRETCYFRTQKEADAALRRFRETSWLPGARS